MILVGDQVLKNAGDYQARGTVRAILENPRRYVVAITEIVHGTPLMIYSDQQLVHADIAAAAPDPWRPISEYDRTRDGWVLCAKYGDKSPTVAAGLEQGEWWINICLSAVEKPDVWMPLPTPPKVSP